jgi:small-conductance mechanosensitive channel
MREAERVLVYTVYTIGLVALAYVILSSPVSPAVESNVWAMLNFLTGLLVTYLAVSTINVVVKRYSAALAERDPRLETAIAFVRRLGLAIIGLIGVAATTFASFPTAGAAIASLFIAAGFGSIVVGLAAQSSLSNMFAGMVLAFSQPFKIGDAVLFKDEWCWVEDMRLNFTILKTWDNRRLVIPNQMFLNDSLINYDLNDSAKLCIVYLQVPYETDLDRAIEIMKDEALKHQDFLSVSGLPIVHVMEYNESGINLRLLSRAKDQPTNFQMSKDLLYSIRREFQKNGIEIAYPRREVVLRRESGEALGATLEAVQSLRDPSGGDRGEVS